MIRNIPVYVINYKNEDRRKRMNDRFNIFGVVPKFVPGVDITDERLSNVKDDIRNWSIMLQHLDSIRDFYENTSLDHCIVCEDDIHISKTFDKDIDLIVKSFVHLKLDVIMLGYLLPFKINMSCSLHKRYFSVVHSDEQFIYHKYPDDIWGTQMYLISRKYAQFLLQTFDIEHALAHPKPFTYNPDWIITKNGERALIVPMIAVEEGTSGSEYMTQVDFHSKCTRVNYEEKKYI